MYAERGREVDIRCMSSSFNLSPVKGKYYMKLEGFTNCKRGSGASQDDELPK